MQRRLMPQAAVLLSHFLLFTSTTHAENPQADVTTDAYRQNTGPLTTTFTPDPTCLSEPHTEYPWEGAYPELILGCKGPGGDECCPERWGKNRYFSPGVCPSGYFGCTLPTTRQREETTNLCCPSNFDCPTEVSYGVCRSSLNTWRYAEYTDREGLTSKATFLAVSATPIQIRFRQTDSDVVPIPTDSLNLPPPLTEEELKEIEEGKGLSTGAKAGIGVGVAVGVVALVATLVWCLRKKATAKNESNLQQGTFFLADQTTSARPSSDEAPPPYTKR